MYALIASEDCVSTAAGVHHREAPLPPSPAAAEQAVPGRRGYAARPDRASRTGTAARPMRATRRLTAASTSRSVRAV
jgi:hypothetical protein